MNKQAIFELIVQHTKEIIPELETHAFVITDELKELGANSVDRAEIITLTIESLSLDIPLITFSGAQNIEDLVETFYEQQVV
ncbi:acyl carrier protein [Chitinophaga pinensis]|uniref:Acyl carrier protein n=1 Tax=Chitinophaga pinensis (strain ATCC 43595 / DSM 2588 / LMG 13176 / NBRC 15968 / NCIMB 11800 / UQM 2034) TaxID=485918 RepID=A0A979GUE8_CHIPD|nr:acyl carrier protein [Chitinophaga pinensis]ACU62733.1 acyl carrier protein [Chitinophaga pinensis DSM 2588]